ncbi:aminotransferase class I/II-fold pyridoxal phosphate-dependent enzyme [Peptococcaceae bacterium]|nr:aminotransferase class I/II-fold pyridoxal phosphate-dependent enzyme [Peptococcaceae bacterium]
MNQLDMPLIDALKEYCDKNKIAFHIPAHRQGKSISSAMVDLGKEIFKYDLTEVHGLDDLHSPKGVIAQAQKLAARAFGSKESYFLVNGSSSGIETMILSVCSKEEDILLVPRHAHRSVLSGIILSGAFPVYIYPEIIDEFNIAGFVSIEEVKKELEYYENVKAIFMLTPTYYGIATCLDELSTVAHKKEIPLLVDEAHGAHFYFNDSMPKGALKSGADLVVQSLHKTASALTQASILHLNSNRININKLKWCLQMLQTTSPSYILMASLDAARNHMVVNGRELLTKSLEVARKLRKKLSSIKGIEILSNHHLKNYDILSLDETRIVIKVTGIGITGYQTAELLSEDYNIEVEMADSCNIVVLLGLDASFDDADALYRALLDIKERFSTFKAKSMPKIMRLPKPVVVITPRKAFMSSSKTVALEESLGEVSACSIAVYPPGIPAICPGEIITEEVLEYLLEVRERGLHIQCSCDSTLKTIDIVEEGEL